MSFIKLILPLDSAIQSKNGIVFSHKSLMVDVNKKRNTVTPPEEAVLTAQDAFSIVAANLGVDVVPSFKVTQKSKSFIGLIRDG